MNTRHEQNILLFSAYEALFFALLALIWGLLARSQMIMFDGVYSFISLVLTGLCFYAAIGAAGCSISRYYIVRWHKKARNKCSRIVDDMNSLYARFVLEGSATLEEVLNELYTKYPFFEVGRRGSEKIETTVTILYLTPHFLYDTIMS